MGIFAGIRSLYGCARVLLGAIWACLPQDEHIPAGVGLSAIMPPKDGHIPSGAYRSYPSRIVKCSFM